MDKRQLMACLFLTAGISSFAQNTSPYWSLAGNNNATTSSKLGTTTAVPLNIQTNSATRIKIFEDGRVGIGSRITNANATRTLSLADANAVMRIIRIHRTNAPAVELLSRTAADGPNVAYWDMYAEPKDASFRIRDRIGGGAGLDRLTIFGNGNVGIGTTTPYEKLWVEGRGLFTQGITVNDGGMDVSNNEEKGKGIIARGHTGLYGDGYMYGVEGHVDSDPEVTGGLGAGVYGYGSNGVIGKGSFVEYDPDSDYNPGLQGEGVFGVAYTGVYGRGYGGVYGISSTQHDLMTGSGVGVYGYGAGAGRIGVKAYSEQGVGIRAGTGNASSYAGYFDGDIFASGLYVGSDEKLKQNINKIKNALGLIKSLQPKTYEYRTEGRYADMNLPTGTRYGLIAQDVETVLPSLVKETVVAGPAPQAVATSTPEVAASRAAAGGTPPVPFGTTTNTPKADAAKFKAVNYLEIIPILLKAMQELSEENDELKARLDKMNGLEDRLQTLERNFAQKNYTTADATLATLDQNAPNPARNATMIRYMVPDGAAVVKLTLKNNKGQLIKTINLTARGTGQLSLDTTMLPAGIYHYTLWIEGRDVDTKKLIVTR